MEPSDKSFARSFHFVDTQGEEISLGASFGGQHSRVERLPASAHSHNKRHTKAISTTSFASVFSENSLVQSVLTSGAMVLTDKETDEMLQELPRRYKKGSIKAKVTWFGLLCLAGVGMFVEAFVIITTGQIKTVWGHQYPVCWDAEDDQPCPGNIQCCGLFPNTPDSVCNAEEPYNGICTEENEYPDRLLCTESQIGAVSYSEFAGIMLGMVTFGWIADRIGRKNAGTLTAFLMVAGMGGMTFFDNDDTSLLFLVFSILFGIFGLGVGGEYPLTASLAAEQQAESKEDALMDDEEQRHHRLLIEVAKTARRGETISMVFAMQGVGAVVGSVFLLAFIYFSKQGHTHCDLPGTNSQGIQPSAANGIWRGFYFVGLIFVLMLFMYRSLVLEEGEGYHTVAARRIRRDQRLGKEAAQQSWKMVFRFYSSRLIGTGGNWFVWDVAFYGLKLFSGPIFADINPLGDLVVQNGYLLVNNLCALVGYYAAARVIDIPRIGRKRLQMFSFSMCSIIFMITAGIFDSAPTGVIIFLFFASSFFGSFGANVTTYVMAAETYPTELRGTFHGLSAFLGKIGALAATIGFHYLDTDKIFWVCGACGVVGLFCTWVFSCDLTNVSLAEHDAQLEMLLAGRIKHYKGKLNDPKHLSNFEVWTGHHGKYDPNWVSKFIKDKVQELAESSPPMIIEGWDEGMTR